MDLLHWAAVALLTLMCVGQLACVVMLLRAAHRQAEAQEASAEALATLADSKVAEVEAQAQLVMSAAGPGTKLGDRLTARCSRCGSMMSLCRCKPAA